MKTFWTGTCLSVLLLLSACGEAPETPPSSTDAAPPAAVPTDTAPGQTGELALDSFDRIEVDVLAADIRLTTGDSWSLSYDLSEKEPLEQLGVVGSTLYVETRFDPLERPDLIGGWHVTITVPEGTALSDVELSSIAGEVSVQDLTCDEVSLGSTAGSITAQQLQAREAEAESISGNLSLLAIQADSLEAESTSGKLELEGTFGELETSTVSGSTAITAAITGSAEIESVSGGIGLTLTAPASIQASSVGGVTLNGDKQGRSLTTSGGVPVEIESVSGKIAIETP